MNASLVYDGRTLNIPASMGRPCPNQMTGTDLECLGELSSRICYDSLGVDPETNKPRGRSSEKLHEHILEVKNHSVYEHANFTICLGRDSKLNPQWQALAFLNRKGTWVRFKDDVVEATVNLRAVLEWDRHTTHVNGPASGSIGWFLRCVGNRLAPRIISQPTHPYLPSENHIKTENLTDDQAWVSLWLYGSRGFTHEQVRHRFAMSQRSTRYVDEDGSPYIEHPLVTKFLNDESISKDRRSWAKDLINCSTENDRRTYRLLVAFLETYNVSLGLDKQTARKQARGAARGYLGNALASEMIFSAPVSGWKWILSQRKNKAADAEIRQIYSPALEALKSSQYGGRFAEFREVPSPDGIGTVLA